jgi:hypothetical protein
MDMIGPSSATSKNILRTHWSADPRLETDAPEVSPIAGDVGWFARVLDFDDIPRQQAGCHRDR